MTTSRATGDESGTPPWGEASHRAVFATTHWSVVLAARSSDAPQARASLEKLCQTYWFPLYAYVRRRGYSQADAEDLTQEFFTRILEGDWLTRVDRQRGRFRSFLLASISYFLANEWNKSRRQKRGGGRVMSLPFGTADTSCRWEPADHVTPEQTFEWRWAVALLNQVMDRLRAENSRQGKAVLFEELKPCLLGERSEQPYATLAAKLGMTEGSVKVAVHRLRQRYRQLLREEIANTVAAPGEIDEEMRHLFAVLARR